MWSLQVDTYLFKFFTHLYHFFALIYNLFLFIGKTWGTKTIDVIIYKMGYKDCQQFWSIFNSIVVSIWLWLFKVIIYLYWILFCIKIIYSNKQFRCFDDPCIANMFYFLIPDLDLFVHIFKSSWLLAALCSYYLLLI